MAGILDALKQGERFPYKLLRQEQDIIVEYWDWWWKHGHQEGVVDRIYTLSDDEEILRPTADKDTIDTVTDDEFFPPPLANALQTPEFERGYKVCRKDYRNAIVDHCVEKCPLLAQPLALFVGGGYGAGKTGTLQFLIDNGFLRLGFGREALVGVDYFKQLLPEFNLLKAVRDGRASETCQQESRNISNQLFSRLVDDGRSFAWDSSMSDLQSTLRKVEFARSRNYQLVLIAILTQPEVARRRAMKRAFETKRFPHPNYFEASHSNFWKALPSYTGVFDDIRVLENSADYGTADSQIRIARKTLGRPEFQILDERLWRSYVSPS